MAAAYLLCWVQSRKQEHHRAGSSERYLCLCKFGGKKLTTSNTFVHRRAESVDERVPCFSEEVEHKILSSSFDRFQDAVAPFESVSGSSSSSRSSFSQYFSPRSACYSW